MKELSSRAQELVDAARAADSPKSNDRARVQARLTAALGASAFTAVASQAAAMAASGVTSAAASGAAAALAGGAAASSAAPVVVAPGSVSAAAASGAAPVVTTGGLSAAAASGAAGAVSGAAAASGAAGAVSGAAAASGAAGAIAGGGAAAATGASAGAVGWAAALGVKGAAWIGAAAVGAALGTTAVVSTKSHSELNVREAPAEIRNTSAVAHDSVASTRVGASRVSVGPALPALRAAVDSPVPSSGDVQHTAEPTPGATRDSEGSAAKNAAAPVAARSGSAARSSRRAMRGQATPAAAAASPTPAPAASTAVVAPSEVERPATDDASARATLLNAAPESQALSSAPPANTANAAGELGPSASPPDSERARQPVPLAAAVTPLAAAARVAAVGSSRVQLPKAVRAVAPQPRAALSAELELLAKAQRALHDGKLSLALTLLDQHGAQHAQGTLREERMAARAVVLCRMHQVGAGLAEVNRLASQTPRSPLLPWVHENCKR